MFADAPATEGPAKNRGEVLKQPEGREVGVKRNNKDSALIDCFCKSCNRRRWTKLLSGRCLTDHFSAFCNSDKDLRIIPLVFVELQARATN